MKNINNACTVHFQTRVIISPRHQVSTAEQVFEIEKRTIHLRPAKRRGSLTFKSSPNLSPNLTSSSRRGMVLQAWRQLYLFKSKPKRLPLQVGSAKSGPSGYFPSTAGTSSESEAGPGNVLFVGDANSVRLETGCRASATDGETCNRKIQLIYNVDRNILASIEPQPSWNESNQPKNPGERYAYL